MASRTVAGGPSEASDHRIHDVAIFDRPRRGRGSNTRRREFPPRPLPRSENRGTFVDPAVARFARTAGYRTRRLRRQRNSLNLSESVFAAGTLASRRLGPPASPL